MISGPNIGGPNKVGEMYIDVGARGIQQVEAGLRGVAAAGRDAGASLASSLSMPAWASAMGNVVVESEKAAASVRKVKEEARGLGTAFREVTGAIAGPAALIAAASQGAVLIDHWINLIPDFKERIDDMTLAFKEFATARILQNNGDMSKQQVGVLQKQREAMRALDKETEAAMNNRIDRIVAFIKGSLFGEGLTGAGAGIAALNEHERKFKVETEKEKQEIQFATAEAIASIGKENEEELANKRKEEGEKEAKLAEDRQKRVRDRDKEIFDTLADRLDKVWDRWDKVLDKEDKIVKKREELAKKDRDETSDQIFKFQQAIQEIMSAQRKSFEDALGRLALPLQSMEHVMHLIKSNTRN